MSLLITEIHFKCNGCGHKWWTYVDPPLNNAAEIKAWLDTRMQPCPRNCGGRTADVAFRIGQPSMETDHE